MSSILSTISEEGVIGICSVSVTLPLIPVLKNFVVCIGVCIFCPSTLSNWLQVSHSLSNSIVTVGFCTLRGGRFNCGVVEVCSCESYFDWAVSFTEPSPLSDFWECLEVSLSDFYLDLSVSELPLRLTLGVGSLAGSKRKFSKGIVVSLLSL